MGTLDSMCKCEKRNICLMQNTEIVSKNLKEINNNKHSKSPNKNKDLKNSFQISGKITEFISSNKIEQIEDDIYLLNTAKNTIPSNNPISNRSNPQNNSSFNDIQLNSFHIENNNDKNKGDNNKVDYTFEQISKIEDNNDNKKSLFTRGSKNNLEELLNTLNKESKTNKNNNNKDINNKEISENKKSIIDDKEKCLDNDDDKQNIGKTSQLNGYAKYTDENGTFYEGYFDNGKLNGEGIIIKRIDNNNESDNSMKSDEVNKITYVGNIKNFKKEGFGKETSIEYKYEGQFHNDMKNGKGKIHFVNTDDFYEGEFTNDKITGFGKYIWANKHEYIGDLIDGEMHGKGKYKWPDGSEYIGQYINNIKEGEGEFKWSNGAVFKGNFTNGKPNGKGIMSYKGHNFDAEFKKGKFVGNLKSILKSINRLKK